MENFILSSSKESFNEVISELIKFRSTVEKKPIPSWVVDKKMLVEVYSFLKKLPYLFLVPVGLMKKIKGVSELGQMEETFKVLIQEAQEMDRFAEFLSKRENLI